MTRAPVDHLPPGVLADPPRAVGLHRQTPVLPPGRFFNPQRACRGQALRGAVAALLAAGLCGCGLPALDGRPPSSALTGTHDTRLGQALAPLVAAHPRLSGVYPLPDGRDALTARLLLADVADRSIDVQVYIWHGDLSGTLLLKALHRAAERGVRVRMLLDDNGTHLDDTLAALDAHPLIEVRLFNPFASRRWPWLGYLTDFERVNRRMHNKSFTVDNQVTIVGGRNVGDEYFDAGQSTLFIDLDVLAAGPVASEVSTDFDRYWASASAYPINRLVPTPDASAIERLTQQAAAVLQDPRSLDYRSSLARSTLVEDMQNQRLPLEWTLVRLVSDDPAKGLGHVPEQQLIGTRMFEKMGQASQELTLVSPYFVPTSQGVAALAALAQQGVQVHVLTNSLAATDVAAVHAGYGKRRRQLLQSGVRLYEMKPSANAVRSASGDRGPIGSSAASLHAKTFAIDRQRVFVGSFNFDPRSVRLNTEMGLVIDSPQLAAGLAAPFTTGGLAAHAYEVRLDAQGHLQWIESDGHGGSTTHATEPQSSFWRRLSVQLLSWLPIEPLL